MVISLSLTFLDKTGELPRLRVPPRPRVTFMLFTEGMAKYFATILRSNCPPSIVGCSLSLHHFLARTVNPSTLELQDLGTLGSSSEGVSDSDGAGAGTFDESSGDDSQPFVALLQGVGDFPPSGVGEFPLSGLRELPLPRARLSWTVCVLATFQGLKLWSLVCWVV